MRNPCPGHADRMGPARALRQTYTPAYCHDSPARLRDWPFLLRGPARAGREDGYYRILAASTTSSTWPANRSGRRKLESAVLMVPEVAEAAALPVIDE